MTQRLSTTIRFFLCLFCLSVASCSVITESRLQQLSNEVPSFYITEKVTLGKSPFNQLIDKSAAFGTKDEEYLQDHLHYINILNTGEDALLARLHLIRSAQESIHIQTFIWQNDESGRFIAKELIQAAKRGVRVKVLVDKLGFVDDPAFVAYFQDSHPNIDLKFYNPSANRMTPSAIHVLGQAALKFKKFNQRMHNKIMVFDDRVAITGGRNVENDYFDLGRTRNFKDRDVLVVGPVVQAMNHSFARYWAYKLSVPATDLSDVQKAISTKSYKQDFNNAQFQFGNLFKEVSRRANDSGFISQKFVDEAMKARKVMFVADEPWKNKSRGLKGGGKATKQLVEILAGAKESIIFQTPYLVLDRYAYRAFKRIRKNNPDIDILISTNSLANTDHITAYSYVFKRKKVYVKNLKFQIFEMKPQPADITKMIPNMKTRSFDFFPAEQEGIFDEMTEGIALPDRKRFVCVHAKSFVVDDDIAWIGSFNLDPRSIHLNTEVGLVIWDKKVAQTLKDELLRDIAPQNSWVVGKAQEVPLVSRFSGLVGTVVDAVPVVDVWPFQYTSLYELKEGKEAVPFYHQDFDENYRDVGPFPEVGLSIKQIHLRLLKAFIGVAEPLI